MDKLKESFGGLIELIQKHTDSEEAANLLLYFEDKITEMDYNGLGSVFRYRGGLVDYLTTTIQTAVKLSTVYSRFGAEPVYTINELVRSLVFFEVGKLSEDYDYLPEKDQNLSVLLEAKIQLSQNEFEFLRFAPDPFNKNSDLNTIGFIALRTKELVFDIEAEREKDSDESIEDKIEVKTPEPVKEEVDEEPPFDPDPAEDVEEEVEKYFDQDDEDEDDSVEDLMVDDQKEDRGVTTEEAFDYESNAESEKDPMREEAAASFEEIFGENVFEG